MLLEDSIEYKKASRVARREGAHVKAFARLKSFQTVVFLDWSRCWKSGLLLCVYPSDDRRRRRPLSECTEPNIGNNDTNEEKRTGYKQSERQTDRERERGREREVVPSLLGRLPQGAQSRISSEELESLREICYLTSFHISFSLSFFFIVFHLFLVTLLMPLLYNIVRPTALKRSGSCLNGYLIVVYENTPLLCYEFK